MAKPSVSSHPITKFFENDFKDYDDLLAVEEPLEIRLAFGNKNNRKQKNISVTMRTPGNDFELALGFLFTEGIIQNKSDVLRIRYCEKQETILNKENIVLVDLVETVSPNIQTLERNFYMSSSCGICGKASIEAIHTIQEGKRKSQPQIFQIKSEIILTLPQKLKEQQIIFGHTGGLHAAALFDEEGNMLLLREDIGRHNALDKIIGASIQKDLTATSAFILFLSGRSSFELIQKAVMAGIHCVVSVGAPSNLAVSLAKEFNISLIGFVRDYRYNIYCGQNRIIE